MLGTKVASLRARRHTFQRPINADKGCGQQIKRRPPDGQPGERAVFALCNQHHRQKQKQVGLDREERQQRTSREILSPLDQLRGARHYRHHDGDNPA